MYSVCKLLIGICSVALSHVGIYFADRLVIFTVLLELLTYYISVGLIVMYRYDNNFYKVYCVHSIFSFFRLREGLGDIVLVESFCH